MRYPIPRAALCLLIVWLVAMVGCRRTQKVNHNYSFNPDEGGNVSTAQGLFFGMSVDDRLNTELGDDVDWRYILVTEPGKLSVQLRLDNPQMMGNWYLRDEVGRVIHFKRLDPREEFYEIVDVPVEPGRYYFHIEAIKGSTIYTVKSTFAARPRAIADVSVGRGEPQVVRNQPEDQERILLKKPKPKPRRRRRRPKVDTPKPVDQRAVLTSYEGDLLLITQDGATKQVFVTIKMEKSLTGLPPLSSDRVRTLVLQQRGELKKAGAELTISNCDQAETTCTGTINSRRPVNLRAVNPGDIRIRIEVLEGP